MEITPVIKIVEFAKERDPSIDKMIKKMESQKPSHKRCFQKLPKHLRRRAMSYDIKKVPRSMRPAVEDQLKGAAEAKERNKPSGRDPRKYRQHGENLMAHRNHEFKWLESHLWHAKRFHMADMWGWKIPWAPTMKQTRSLVKMTKENCTMRDISYMAILSIKVKTINEENEISQTLPPSPETKNILCAKLSELLRPNFRIETNHHILFPVELFKPNQFPNSPIGPAEAFWVDDNNFWIICHPLLLDSIIESFNTEISEENIQLDVEVINGELNIYEIYGPNASEAIRSVLQPNTDETPKEITQIVNSLPGPSCVPPGLSIAYVANDPRTIEDHIENNQPSTTNSFDYNSLNIPNLCESTLFTDRSFTFKSDADFNTERSRLLFPKAEGPSGSIPVIIMQQFSHPSSFPSNSIGFGSNWLVFIPFGCGNVVFRKFAHHGVRMFGLECSHLIDLEDGKFNFPYDRPETPDGYQIFTNEIKEQLQTNERRPPGKRKSLNFYTFPDNFYISYSPENRDSELAYVRVGLLMVKRGTPSRFSTVYLPEKEDYELFTIEKGQNEGQNPLKNEIKGTRRPIGIVMNGNSSLLAGDGRGIAIVRAQAFSQFLPDLENEMNFTFKKRPKQSRLAIVREQGSQFLHLAWIWLHPSNFLP